MRTATSEAHALNQSAATIYDLCDGNTSKSEMAAEIHRRTGLPANEEIVDLAFAELVETGLVVLNDVDARSTLIQRLALSSDAPDRRNRFGTTCGRGCAAYSIITARSPR